MRSIFAIFHSADELAAQVEKNFLYTDEARRLIGVPKDAQLSVEWRGAGESVAITYTGERHATLRISGDDAQRVMAYARSAGWANGITLIPTLARLAAAGAFAGLDVGARCSIRAFAQTRKTDPSRNLGLLWGAFHLLALAGWVVIDGADTDARYALTLEGSCAVARVAAADVLFRRAADATAMLQHLHALCHGTRVNRDDSAAYVALVDQCIAGWPLPPIADALGQRVDERLRGALDGFLLGPTWVALDMPVFETHDGQSSKVMDGIFEAFDASSDWVSMRDGWPHANRTVLDAAWRLLHYAGMVDIDTDREWVRLNALGRMHRPIAASYAGLAASYLRSYAMLNELLFGDPDPLDIEHDGHIDRVMNVYAMKEISSGAALQEAATKIVHRLFDETPVEQQPSGIADIGCGDGNALRRLAEYVVHSTRRGRRLDDYPLLVVGADYNESARRRAADTLAALAGVPGVQVRVVAADVSQPERYNDTIAASGLTVKNADGGLRPAQLGDLLHTFMFLVHNRRLCARCRDTADEILARHLRSVDRAQLRRVVDRYFPGRLTVSMQALEPIAHADLKAAFRVGYSDADGLVPGYVAAADLLDFFARWKRYVAHGFLIAEAHCPWAVSEPADWRAAQARSTCIARLPSIFTWGMHFVSRQYLMPFHEFMLTVCLAGLQPRDTVYGRIYPQNFPAPDQLDDYRYLSIAEYVAAS
ncbi:hypothetical protein WS67_04675 [Burkholderia singularis]|uniref:AprA-like MT2-like domain-containing protein n=1 Tax=Burkholderia singularis TaxID=1503053 RepID=A0A124P9T0_9BURK|nr:class I SAM-dependent methyltransferase [Burkholderia singularis]KVE29482.1 hypothetical protein WS67_04675 [Burkholderia singularis]